MSADNLPPLSSGDEADPLVGQSGERFEPRKCLMGMRGTVQPQWVPARCWMEQNGEERHAEMRMVHGDILSHTEMWSSEIAGRPETVDQ